MALYSEPAVAGEVKLSRVSLRLLRSKAFFLIAWFLWNMEFLNHHIWLTLLRTQVEFNHFDWTNQFNCISICQREEVFNPLKTKNPGFETPSSQWIILLVVTLLSTVTIAIIGIFQNLDYYLNLFLFLQMLFSILEEYFEYKWELVFQTRTFLKIYRI